LKCKAVLGPLKSYVKGDEGGCLKQRKALLFQCELEHPRISTFRRGIVILMVTMRDDRIGSPCSSHGDPDSINNTWTNAFCDKPGNQLRGPSPRLA